MNKFNKFLTLLCLLLVTTSGCAPKKEETKEIKEINVGLSWIHEAQFAGYYVADQYGYYEQEGIKVNLYPYNDEDLAQELINKKYDFVILQTDSLIEAREKGLPVKAIFADYRIIPTVYFSKKSKGITKPQDLVGKKVGIAYSEKYPLIAMLKLNNINPDNVTIVDREYTYDKLANDEYDVEAGWITDGDTVKNLIGDYNAISPADFGVNWYADLLVTSDGMLESDPELIKSFLRATSKGWEYAVEHIDEAALLTKGYDIEADDEHLKFVLSISSPHIHTGSNRLGWMDEKVFQNVQDILYDQDVIKNKININDIFTTHPLQEIYSSS